MIRIKRIYETPGKEDGYRVLVDRLWPRGISKPDARIDDWWKEYAPSRELRIWFNHEDSRWDEFSSKYVLELHENHATLAERVKQIRSTPVTLVYAAQSKVHNNAVVLQQYIRRRIL